MRPWPSLVSTALALGACIVAAPIASADPSPAEQTAPAVEADEGTGDEDLEQDEHHRPRHDYSRFSDGPRRVPTPRGPSMARAEQLGLGTRDCASRLLHQAPEQRWIDAAGGREPSRLLWPVDEGRWVRGFGYVRTTRPDLIHRGVDIIEEPGTVVRAVADGIVAYSDNGVRGYGNLVLIVHRNGWVSLYAHNARTTVQPGYRVRRGERIALLGSTGIARGPHVHFELRQDGRAIDPAALFDGGPRFVQRIAEREASRGHVAAVGVVTDADRPTEAPLAPHPDDLPHAPVVRSAATPVTASQATTTPTIETTARAAGTTAPTAETPPSSAEARPLPREIDGEVLGSLALARRLTTRAASESATSLVPGRIFTTLLPPLRGGTIATAWRGERSPLRMVAGEEAAVRVAADGLVVFAGELPGRGNAIVVLHRTGWVTTYGGLASIAVRAGDQLARGSWLGRAVAMTFELRVGGVARNPADFFVAAAAQ